MKKQYPKGFWSWLWPTQAEPPRTTSLLPRQLEVLNELDALLVRNNRQPVGALLIKPLVIDMRLQGRSPKQIVQALEPELETWGYIPRSLACLHGQTGEWVILVGYRAAVASTDLECLMFSELLGQTNEARANGQV